MPTYEFRCRACGSTFDVVRPMADSGAAAPCPAGHDDTVKLLTTVGLAGRADAAPSGGGTGCCGGACGCG
ncbi:zinc ribbon domain-containing protein [Jiangella aurantiaca]|uniref:Zinc ribbon domain-containing protein n=1 Tax=Jiangella aurantiaca TaxID=2530373 RepID=A0A4R5A1N1_9ACTN|nr:zinc ribbon domain-containing protein [Jiangella aurantiaca]TDD65778.1 zinc ribbon domain-containing protein [Jiangella aurantiaca]